MWPFENRNRLDPPDDSQRPPDEDGGGEQSYTDRAIEDLVNRASRGAGYGALAVVEIAAGLWERTMASATVEPVNGALAGLTPGLLAMIGRGLALRGNLVCRIRVEGTAVKLDPASDYDIQGAGPDSDDWLYRLSLPGPSDTVTVLLPAASVLHFRCGVAESQPWRGVPPLMQSRTTAGLAGKVESALTGEVSIPVGRLAIATGKTATFLSFLKRGGFYLSGEVASRGLPQEPSARVTPQRYGPQVDAGTQSLRGDVVRDILGVFGVPPALFAERGDGAGQREAWRRFWLGTVQPLALLVQAECKAKLDPSCVVTLDALRAADEDGRSRAVSRRAAAFKTLVDTGMERAEARRLAGLGG